MVIKTPAECLPKSKPLIQSLEPGELVAAPDAGCPLPWGVCATPEGIAKLKDSLAELAEWYNEAQTNCGGNQDEKDSDSDGGGGGSSGSGGSPGGRGAGGD